MSIKIQVNDLAIKINLNDYKVNLHKSYQLLAKSFELSFFLMLMLMLIYFFLKLHLNHMIKSFECQLF